MGPSQLQLVNPNKAALQSPAPKVVSKKGKSLPFKHLLGIEGMEAQDIEMILERAEKYRRSGKHLKRCSESLKGVNVINLFMENSTRTRVSFELAAKRLGAEVTSISVAHSSIRKGETLIDTAQTLRAMAADLLVVRHPHSGAVQLLAEKLDCHVINAGDGFHEHPTQALLDAATIRHRKGGLKGLRVAICGDVRHSRVARSNILLLQKMEASVRIVAPPTLLPDEPSLYGVEVFTDMREGLVRLRYRHDAALADRTHARHFCPLDPRVFSLLRLDARKADLRASRCLSDASWADEPRGRDRFDPGRRPRAQPHPRPSRDRSRRAHELLGADKRMKIARRSRRTPL